MIVAISALLFTACDKNDNVIKLETLAGTTWMYEEGENYIVYTFSADGTGGFLVVVGEEKTFLSLFWECSTAGYVTTIAQSDNTLWESGFFDKDKCTLTMEDTQYELIDY